MSRKEEEGSEGCVKDLFFLLVISWARDKGQIQSGGDTGVTFNNEV